MSQEEERAKEFYAKHLRRQKDYYSTHKDTMRQQMMTNYNKMKSDPEKYKEYLEKKRASYRAKKQAQI